jgi:hypothetical protein
MAMWTARTVLGGKQEASLAGQVAGGRWGQTAISSGVNRVVSSSRSCPCPCSVVHGRQTGGGRVLNGAEHWTHARVKQWQSCKANRTPPSNQPEHLPMRISRVPRPYPDACCTDHMCMQIYRAMKTPETVSAPTTSPTATTGDGSSQRHRARKASRLRNLTRLDSQSQTQHWVYRNRTRRPLPPPSSPRALTLLAATNVPHRAPRGARSARTPRTPYASRICTLIAPWDGSDATWNASTARSRGNRCVTRGLRLMSPPETRRMAVG